MPRSATSWLAPLSLAALAAHASDPVPTPAARAEASGLPSIDAATSLLVVAPHPDDETLCCAGAIQRVVRAGGRVTVVWLTNGDAARLVLVSMSRSLFPAPAVARELGAQRMAEARAAAARLGVPPGGQVFLGYPDGGLLELLTAHRTIPYVSRTTGAAAVPYGEALGSRHPYTGASLEQDFIEVLEHSRPTLILAPTPLDAHADHRAAGLLTQTLAARYAMARYWIVHGGEGWPAPADLLPGVPLTPAPLARALTPQAFGLEPAEEDGKLAALECYRTQLRLTAPFLLSFVRTNELYSLRAF
jgi:LmbE family N-acetylglucosaminyl deacetylase